MSWSDACDFLAETLVVDLGSSQLIHECRHRPGAARLLADTETMHAGLSPGWDSPRYAKDQMVTGGDILTLPSF